MAKLNELDIKTLALECLQNKYIWPASFHGDVARETTPLVFKTTDKKSEEKLILVQVGSRLLAKLSEKEVDTKLMNIVEKMQKTNLYMRRFTSNIKNLRTANAINEEEAMSIRKVVKEYTSKAINANTEVEEVELTAK